MILDASAKHTHRHLCISKSVKCLGPEVEGSKHQSRFLGVFVPHLGPALKEDFPFAEARINEKQV